MYPHAIKFSPQEINNDSGKNVLTFHKISNLRMNNVIDFHFFCESNGLEELHTKYLEYDFFCLREKYKTKDRLLQGR